MLGHGEMGVLEQGSGEDASFGARLRQLRGAAGLTQEELAGRAGLTAKAISMLERGDRKHPYPHTVRAVTEGFFEDLTKVCFDLQEELRALRSPQPRNLVRGASMK